jgi:PPOX class probable F420-dependent enzyme
VDIPTTRPTVPDTHIDLLDRQTGALSTVGATGHPQVTAFWFLLDEDGVIRTSLMRARQKYKNMVAHPQATLFVIDAGNPFRTIEVRADVTFVDDDHAEFFDRIVRHYGHDPATFPAPREDRVVLELHPSRIVTNG